MLAPINFANFKLQEKVKTLADCRDTIDALL